MPTPVIVGVAVTAGGKQTAAHDGERTLGRYFKSTHVVLLLLCLMYGITYIDRVNVGSAAAPMKDELHLSNTQLGLVFSGFAYPYLVFQVIGGAIADRFGPRLTLFFSGLVWASATILTGFVDGLVTLMAARLLLGFGEGATFPAATRAMQGWTSAGNRGFAQGITHAFARLGNAITPPLVAALIAAYTWRGSFVVLGIVSLVWVVVWVFYFRNDPREHPGITAEELATLPPATAKQQVTVPWGTLLRRMWPVTLTYFCYGWCLWLYLNWLPLFFKNTFSLDLKSSAIFASGVFFAGVVGDTLGGVVSDTILHRTKNVRLARLSVTVLGFVGALLSLMPLLFVHDITIVALCLSAGFFFAELVIGPMWSIPMDIAPKYSGTASGLMNVGSASAAIVSPLTAGFLIDMTGNWYLPFILSMVLLGVGALTAFMMRPEVPIES